MINFVTEHKVRAGDSRELELSNDSVALVVTSPPYPMIAQWDSQFGPKGSLIKTALEKGDYHTAFNNMHSQLDKTWSEVARVVMPGGIVCVNVGDAVRTIGGKFQLFPNHIRIAQSFLNLGYTSLPGIIWRKETNAPNKFMGSGMLPPTAYVTLEHEHILIFRNGNKRLLTQAKDRLCRRHSAIFWEERNAWFSDLWTFKGIRQRTTNDPTTRTGAFPFELAYRLVHMFSLREDLVLDPFLGTGTVCLAAMAARRNSVGIERISERADFARHEMIANSHPVNERIQARYDQHNSFVAKGREFRYHNDYLETPVVTSQETDLCIELISNVQATTTGVVVNYETNPPRLRQ